MGEAKNRKLVVVQLSGGNDYLNCVVPYTNPEYIDNRPNVRIEQDDVILLDDQYGFNPAMGPIKDLYDDGKVAIIHGVGYPVPNRSHFRSMDIWHTAEPTKVGDEGWLGQAVREMHPDGDNVVAAVNFGAALPRALVAKNAPLHRYPTSAPTACSTTWTAETSERRGPRSLPQYVHPRHRQRPRDGLPQPDRPGRPEAAPTSSAACLICTPPTSNTPPTPSPSAPATLLRFSPPTSEPASATPSTAASTPIPTKSRSTRPSGDHVAGGIYDLYTDLKEHDASEDVLIFVFSEFGRRVKDNGNGTDHGSGGVAFMIGDGVNGGNYSPNTRPSIPTSS